MDSKTLSTIRKIEEDIRKTATSVSTLRLTVEDYVKRKRAREDDEIEAKERRLKKIRMCKEACNDLDGSSSSAHSNLSTEQREDVVSVDDEIEEGEREREHDGNGDECEEDNGDDEREDEYEVDLED